MALKPWLWLSPHIAHKLSPWGLKVISYFRSTNVISNNSLDWQGLHFANRLGLAGGVDKNGHQIKSWWTMGPGFLEIGTVTPRPQGPNPGKIMDRFSPQKAVWNKMGFPNDGMDILAQSLEKLKKPYPTPLFINIGKNRDTPNEKAVEDYRLCYEKLHAWGDAFVINISSPNTKGLRDLQGPQFIKDLVSELRKVNKSRKPFLVKLSPDLSDENLSATLEAGLEIGVDGWLLTNTTLSRPTGIPFPKEGGLSGAPLKELSKDLLKRTIVFLGDKKKSQLIVSVGGVMNAEDYRERLEMGADLVQVYSALIYEGPFFFQKTLSK